MTACIVSEPIRPKGGGAGGGAAGDEGQGAAGDGASGSAGAAGASSTGAGAAGGDSGGSAGSGGSTGAGATGAGATGGKTTTGTGGGGSGGAAAGTGAAGSTGSDAGAANDASGGNMNTSYATFIGPLLKLRCGGCHFGGNVQGGFAVSYTAVMAHVSAATSNCSSLDATKSRIVPGKPENSLIYIKTFGTSPPSGCGGHMPYMGTSLTTDQQMDLQDWILQGAKP